MEIKDIGVIYEIESKNFLADGTLYINKIIEPKQDDDILNITIANKITSSFAFENVITNIIENSNLMHKTKTEGYYKGQLTKFFNDNKDKKLDIIIFPETGIKGVDKIDLKEASILYLALYGNVKIGFFINKTIAKVVFGDEV